MTPESNQEPESIPTNSNTKIAEEVVTMFSSILLKIWNIC